MPFACHVYLNGASVAHIFFCGWLVIGWEYSDWIFTGLSSHHLTDGINDWIDDKRTHKLPLWPMQWAMGQLLLKWVSSSLSLLAMHFFLHRVSSVFGERPTNRVNNTWNATFAWMWSDSRSVCCLSKQCCTNSLILSLYYFCVAKSYKVLSEKHIRKVCLYVLRAYTSVRNFSWTKHYISVLGAIGNSECIIKLSNNSHHFLKNLCQ